MKPNHNAIEMRAKTKELVQDYLLWWKEQGNERVAPYLAEQALTALRAEFNRQIALIR
jgi:hypothetical protein